MLTHQLHCADVKYSSSLLGLLGAAIASFASGCAIGGNAHSLVLSQDGKRAAYVYLEGMGIAGSMSLRIEASGLCSESIRWCDLDKPDEVQSYPVTWASPAPSGVSDLVFSPDGKRLAFKTGGEIAVLRTADRKIWNFEPGGQRVIALQWFSNSTICYATRTASTGGECAFWRQASGSSNDERVRVAAVPEWLSNVAFSPGGRYALLEQGRDTQVPSSGTVCVLDMATGETLSFGRPGGHISLDGYSWKADESALFCTLIGESQAWLVRPADRVAQDVTDMFVALADANGGMLAYSDLEPLWCDNNRWVAAWFSRGCEEHCVRVRLEPETGESQVAAEERRWHASTRSAMTRDGRRGVEVSSSGKIRVVAINPGN